ncbi:MAG: ribonuclease domain-containing protein [Rhodocyclaceae bacterium]
MSRTLWVIAHLLLAVMLSGASAVSAREVQPANTVTFAQLPTEARETIQLIRRGGPFPYSRDGIEFRNRERLLPPRPRQYYREFTVRTPGESTRGARRIIAGSDEELYYTADHYRSFRRVTP